MKRNPADRMKDPFYAGLLLSIERVICHVDEDAREAGVTLTDSQVRSSLIKAMKMVQGGNPALPGKNQRDVFLNSLIMTLYHAPDEIREQTVDADGKKVEKPLEIADWIAALETVVDSIKTRSTGYPGGRGYLDFVHDFVAQAG